ncbi:Ig-like domain-containing protein [Anaerocolumna xylanovorans]|uniref:Ig-like domain (Group 2) n=1 Tax=Anaerocolumna xylanovorans DSM 12503 TaxID=1121345 RepID=A0A1M7YN38_9FIRM|nr:Ig-like domain-containing protein [Anaerocolumna xylanovorans]SHO54012.1 Ig-like domain (group 2) [Anaerocolumna xylanovorans DSM 12503]
MPRTIKILLSILLCIALIFLPGKQFHADTFGSIPFVILSDYSEILNIGDEFQLYAVTSNGNFPTFKSSNSKVASVNTYGSITAKSTGTALITAKINKAEASCKITVQKTSVDIRSSKTSIEAGETLSLSAKTSNGSPVVWKSTLKSIAAIDENGLVTGIKPGKAVITATADKSTASITITVKSPVITLNRTTLSLYRGQTFSLSAAVSSKLMPSWKTNKKSVATVEENGLVTARKHGTAVISATVSGVTKTCTVTVKQPEITFDSYDITIKKGEKKKITATVSSGNVPIWSSSNLNIASVDSSGTVIGVEKGKAYIYAAEDGIKIRCTVKVTQ